MRAAVAIGGTSALAACARKAGRDQSPASPQFPRGPDDLASIPERQHAWGQYLFRDRQGVIVFPRHQAFVFLDYVGDEPPSESDRKTVESAFRTLERAYQRGTGGDGTASKVEGLLFTVGYSPYYFDRFDDDVPAALDLPRPESVLAELGEDESAADRYDAVLHLGSDYPDVLLSAEEALFGELERINGQPVEGSLSGVFERAERRTGFVGRGLPEANLDTDAVPKRAPASMGFKSNFADTFPPEDKATIDTGPVAGGTVQHVSRLEIDLGEWYDQDHADRVEKMFSPEHTPEDTGEVGDFLGSESGIDADVGGRTLDHARQRSRVGHGQKIARVRDEDDEPIILRRGDFNSAIDSGSVLHFGSIQSGMADFVKTREAMNDIGFETDGDVPDIPDAENGILDVLEVTNRANFLMPPRSLRALPTPRP